MPSRSAVYAIDSFPYMAVPYFIWPEFNGEGGIPDGLSFPKNVVLLPGGSAS
jgi:hypothetical protein